MGIGQLVIILLLTSQIEVLGWRGSFLALAVLGLVLIVPLMLLKTPLTAPREPAGEKGSPAGSGSQWTVSASLREPNLWYLIVIYAICGFQDFFVATHVVAYARAQGVGAVLSGNLYALMGLVGLAGVLAAGLASDRFGPILPTLVCFVLRIALFGVGKVTESGFAIIGFALIFGLTFWITAPLTIVFVRQYFGTAHLGTLTGIIVMVHHAAGGLGAYVGGAAYALFGSYQVVFQLMLILSVVALLIPWLAARTGHFVPRV